MQKPSGWQPDCPINVVTELGAGAAVSESSGEPQRGSWWGSLEAERGLQRIECLREGKGERENEANYRRKSLISNILVLIWRRIWGKEIAPGRAKAGAMGVGLGG